MVIRPRRDEVWLVCLDPVVGSEMQKTRPCVVVSPDEMNNLLQTVMVAPMTTTIRSYPFRVDVMFQGRSGQVALDQTRAVSIARMVRRLGALPARAAVKVGEVMQEIFDR